MSVVNYNNKSQLYDIIRMFNHIKENGYAIPGDEFYEGQIQRFREFFCNDIDKTIEMLNNLDFTDKGNSVIIENSFHIVLGLETKEDKETFINALRSLKEKYPNNQEVQVLFEHAISDCNTVKDDGWSPYY